MPLDAGLYLDHLRSDGPALARAAESVLDRAVPGCPEWSGRGLVGHIGVIHRWVAGILRQQARSRPDRSSLPPPPEADGELMSWYGEGLGELVGALGETDPATEVWTFQGGRGPALFWFRRMAHETALHRWDAESVSGDPERLPTPLAVDGIAELLEVLLARTWQSGPPPDLGG